MKEKSSWFDKILISFHLIKCSKLPPIWSNLIACNKTDVSISGLESPLHWDKPYGTTIALKWDMSRLSFSFVCSWSNYQSCHYFLPLHYTVRNLGLRKRSVCFLPRDAKRHFLRGKDPVKKTRTNTWPIAPAIHLKPLHTEVWTYESNDSLQHKYLSKSPVAFISGIAPYSPKGFHNTTRTHRTRCI